jgi:hypothetical protein
VVVAVAMVSVVLAPMKLNFSFLSSWFWIAPPLVKNVLRFSLLASAPWWSRASLCEKADCQSVLCLCTGASAPLHTTSADNYSFATLSACGKIKTRRSRATSISR